MTSQIAQPLSRNDIRDFTYNLRKAIGVEDKPYFPIMRFLELLLPQLDEKFELQIYSEQEMGDAHGLTYPEQHVIRLRRDVYDGACDGKGRDHFTVAHEVGHYFLHTPARIVLAKLEQGTSVPEYMNPEWQADAFAGELLVAANLMKGVPPEIIAEQCGVSLSAARYQYGKM